MAIILDRPIYGVNVLSTFQQSSSPNSRHYFLFLTAKFINRSLFTGYVYPFKIVVTKYLY